MHSSTKSSVGVDGEIIGVVDTEDLFVEPGVGGVGQPLSSSASASASATGEDGVWAGAEMTFEQHEQAAETRQLQLQLQHQEQRLRRRSQHHQQQKQRILRSRMSTGGTAAKVVGNLSSTSSHTGGRQVNTPVSNRLCSQLYLTMLIYVI